MPPTKKKAVRTKSGRINKSAWIRSQPASLSAKEVVQRATAEGIGLSLAQVYTARSTAKKSAGATSATSKRSGPAAAPTGMRPGAERTKSEDGDLRRQFMVLAIRMGTHEAQALLDQIVQIEAGD